MVPNLRKASSFFPSAFNDFWRDDFPTFFEGKGHVPAVNVVEGKKEFRIEVAAPGLTKDNFKVKVNNNILEMSSEIETKKEEKDKEEKVLRREFGYTSFYRSFTLPEGIDTGKIEAKQKEGVIEIILPKKEEAEENKVKEIEIK